MNTTKFLRHTKSNQRYCSKSYHDFAMSLNSVFCWFSAPDELTAHCTGIKEKIMHAMNFPRANVQPNDLSNCYVAK